MYQLRKRSADFICPSSLPVLQVLFEELAIAWGKYFIITIVKDILTYFVTEKLSFLFPSMMLTLKFTCCIILVERQ